MTDAAGAHPQQDFMLFGIVKRQRIDDYGGIVLINYSCSGFHSMLLLIVFSDDRTSSALGPLLSVCSAKYRHRLGREAPFDAVAVRRDHYLAYGLLDGPLVSDDL